MARGANPKDDSVETDAKLNVERERTNEELLERSNALGEDADDVIRRARERARAVLALGRHREDQSQSSPGGSNAPAEVTSERARADDALQFEHSQADVVLREERASRFRALIQLLATERGETDEALAIERQSFDQMLSVRDDVLAGVAHDIRGLLNLLVLNASVITMRSTEREIIVFSDTMLRAAAQMDTLLADLLDVARMDNDELVIRPAPADVVSLVRNAVELNAPAAEARSVDLAFDASTPSIELPLDAPRVTRVLMNLLGNAIKFTPDGGRVTVSVKRLAREVEVAVADTGPGIPSDQLEVIFDRFRQSDTAANRAGYGLGLYIARAIVHAHRGRIWVENIEHQGATFTFRLPTDESTGRA